jgi:peptidoglycan/LPS O-acetylase OafA/YrhL
MQLRRTEQDLASWTADCSECRHSRTALPHSAAAIPVSPTSVLPSGEAPRRTVAWGVASYSPAPRSPRRVQTIDGLRAVAIALVFLNHASATAGVPASLALLSRDPHLGLGGTGVKFFFVISGFLITSILLRELDARGTIDRLAFLRRRARRLLPALLAFVLAVAVLRWLGVYAFEPTQLIAALTFRGRLASWELGHLWSMAVQEQFYLAWALVLVLGGRRLASVCAFTLAIAVPLARLVHATLQPDVPSIYLGYGASVDTLALGCLLALHRDRLATTRWFTAVVESRLAIPLLYLAGGLAVLVGWRVGVFLRTPLVTMAIVLLLERCIRHPERGFARLLSSRACVYAGSASYSLYLWQQLFLHPDSTSAVTAFPLNIVAAAGVGLLSFHLVERPLSARRLRSSVRPRALHAIDSSGSDARITMPLPHTSAA